MNKRAQNREIIQKLEEAKQRIVDLAKNQISLKTKVKNDEKLTREKVKFINLFIDSIISNKRKELNKYCEDLLGIYGENINKILNNIKSWTSFILLQYNQLEEDPLKQKRLTLILYNRLFSTINRITQLYYNNLISNYKSAIKKLEDILERRSKKYSILEEKIKEYKDILDEYTLNIAGFNKEVIENIKLSLIEQLTSEIAHKIRNPLTNITSSLFLIENEKIKDPLLSKQLSIIKRGAEKIDRFIQNLVNISTASKINFNFGNINKVILDSVESVKNMVKEVEIKLRLESSLPMICIDLEKIKNCFLILSLNAPLFFENKGVLVIESFINPERTNVIINFIYKNKIFSSKFIKELFDPYLIFRTRSPYLNLYPVMKIIEEHQGRLEVKKNGSKDTIFSISLPLSE
jgi:signal transduction histidine kinase